MQDFNGKVALVTGAGRGIGRAAALALAGRGAAVAANDISPVNLDKTAAQIRANGGKVKTYVADIAKRMPVETMIHEVLDDFERIDILVTASGVQPRAAILDMDEWDWGRTLDVNLSGPFFTIQQVGRRMQEQNGGVIVVLADSAGRSGAIAGRAAYSASKQGLIALARTAALEFAPFNVRVNAVCPGLIETPGMITPASQGKMNDGKADLEKAAAQTPLGRAGSAEEAAALVVFLCSEEASFITGQAINVDGGLVMG